MVVKRKQVSFKEKVMALLEKKGLHDLKDELGLKRPTPRIKLTKHQRKEVERRLSQGLVVAMQLAPGGVKLIDPKFITIAPRYAFEDPKKLAKAREAAQQQQQQQKA